MKALNYASLVVGLLFVAAAAFTLCTGKERCLDGHGEFTGRECR